MGEGRVYAITYKTCKLLHRFETHMITYRCKLSHSFGTHAITYTCKLLCGAWTHSIEYPIFDDGTVRNPLEDVLQFVYTINNY